MAGISLDRNRSRWRVSWCEPGGRRRERVFAQEVDARAFVAEQGLVIRTAGRTAGQVVEHIRANVEVSPTGCWEWTGKLKDDGYARFSWKPRVEKPEEPTGLGAVVEDADGKQWVLAYTGGASDLIRWRSAGWEGHYRQWDSIAAVRVLSEGVTP